MSKVIKRAMAIGAVAASSFAMAGSAQAASVGQLCETWNYPYAVQLYYSAGWIVLPERIWFRVEGNSGSYYIGRPTNRPTVYMPKGAINPATCH